jgi:hypothetical protein
MDLPVFENLEDYDAWNEIFQILSLERFVPLYSMMGIPGCIEAAYPTTISYSQQYLLSLREIFAQSEVVDFEDLRNHFLFTLSRLEDFYGGHCVQSLVDWCSRYIINKHQVDCCFYWSLSIKPLITLELGLSNADISPELAEKIHSVINLENYEERKIEWQNKFHEVSILQETNWEIDLGDQSHLIEDDVFRDDFPKYISPFLISRLEVIDLIGWYDFYYSKLKQLESILSINEREHFLCWIRRQINEEIPSEKLTFPL